MTSAPLNRRQFLQISATLGTGLTLGFHLLPRGVQGQALEIPEAPPSAFVHIAPDNTVTVISKHTEMGQGVYTGLATILGDELDADWSQIGVVAAPANVKIYAHLMLGVQGTGGSMSIPNAWIQYRQVGATARAMLVAAAAERWKVSPKEITVSKGIVSDESGHSATFGELAEAANQQKVPDTVSLKDPSEFTLIGQSLPKVDSLEKSTGKAIYTQDIQTAGQLVAVVAHAPSFGAKLVSFDASKALTIPDVVEVVEIPRGVAVLAKTTWGAMRGRQLLETQWDESEAELRGTEEIISDYRSLLTIPGAPFEQRGDTEAAFAAASKVIESEFVFPYLAHACMEPVNCTIEFDGTNAVLRSGTQMPSMEQSRVAETLGIPEENVSIINLYAGGGFGRKANFVNDMEWETATIVKATDGRYPIKLIYTREDDMRAGFYRPLFVHRLRAALDGNGTITAWESRLVGQSFVKGTFLGFMVQNDVDPLAIEGANLLPYGVPNTSMDYHMAESGVPCLSWRSVSHTHTAYSKETFMDELLEATGQDPIEGRLALMEDVRAKNVIQICAERYGWGKQLPEGIAAGFAYNEAFSGRVAQIVEVTKDQAGLPKVVSVTCVIDIGIAINPHIIEAQVESAIMMGMSAALMGEITIEKGRVQTSNFHDYPVVRLHQAPKIDVVIVPSQADPTGIGEPATPVIGPAIANAWYQLTGQRIRRLPFSRELIG